jgi:hypothetical protein
VSHPRETGADTIIGNAGGDLHKLAAGPKIGGVGRAGIVELEDQRSLAEANPKIALRIESG